MADLRSLVRLLADDTLELRAFLADPERWIGEHGPGLSAHDADELRFVASDLAALVEKRCREELDDSPEQRFSSGQPIERRRFCLTASSALLAGLFLGLQPRTALAAGHSGALESGASDKAPVCDNSCTNTKSATCSDSAGCKDNGCKNVGAAVCRDDEGCLDNECTNQAVLACSDHKSCVDDLCLNDGTECVDYTPCIDGGVNPCGNLVSCPDKPEPDQT